MFKKSVVAEEIDVCDHATLYQAEESSNNNKDIYDQVYKPKDLKNFFTSGTWTLEEGDAKKRLEQDDELYGDFEDLETGERFGANSGEESNASGSENEDHQSGSEESGDD